MNSLQITTQTEYIKDAIWRANEQKESNAPVAVISINTECTAADNADWANITYSIMQVTKKYYVCLHIDFEANTHVQRAALLLKTDLLEWNITSSSQVTGKTYKVASTLFSCSSQGKFEAVTDTDEMASKLFEARVAWVEIKAPLYAMHEDFYALGTYYENGVHTQRSVENAFRYYKKSAELGNYCAQHRLYSFYFHGIGTAKDETLASHWKERAYIKFVEKIEKPVLLLLSKESKTQEECKKLAHLWPIYKNDKEAFDSQELPTESIKQAAMAGIPEAQLELSVSYYLQNQYTLAFHWCHRAEKAGLDIAKNSLGYFYEHGIGVKKNYVQAVRLYTEAAISNLVEAQYNIAVCFENGTGTEQNYREALFWYSKAARGGCASAQHNLAVLFERGKCVVQDKKQAVFWYEQAADGGDKNAQFCLAKYYIKGDVVEKDIQKALALYTKSAEAGHIDAQYELGICYTQNKDIPVDIELGVSWLKKAAENNFPAALYALGVVHDKVHAGSVDEKEVFDLFEKAAVFGHVRAQYELALCYQKGKGTYKCNKKALYWLHVADKLGGFRPAYDKICEIHVANSVVKEQAKVVTSLSPTEVEHLDIEMLNTLFKKLLQNS